MKLFRFTLLALAAAALCAGASAATPPSAASPTAASSPASTATTTVTTVTTTTTLTIAAAPTHRVVFVIVMENHDAKDIIGNEREAPYINRVLLKSYAHATNFVDELPIEIPSEPHYIWMEAGTNRFADHAFTDDPDPSAANSTGATEHLATQIRATNGRVDWRAYQEAMDVARTGACPVASAGLYGAKHDPFVFFHDVAGSPPSRTNAYCASHHKDFHALAGDLERDAVATYNFITPDLCNDMHGARACPTDTVRIGDRWLEKHLPGLIRYADAHDGVIFLTWDEGEDTLKMPFIAIGPHVKKGYAGAVKYTHGSMLKSVERILQLPLLKTVENDTDLADLFVEGTFP